MPCCIFLIPLAFGAAIAIAGVILTSLVAAASAIAGIFLIPPVVFVLSVIGFGVGGPIAGTLAACWQAAIGSVAAGSLFAIAQSVAMGGSITAAIIAIVALIAGLLL
ncbi:hypothetical protein V8E53_004231 [Lactarius tabidus]